MTGKNGIKNFEIFLQLEIRKQIPFLILSQDCRSPNLQDLKKSEKNT